MSQIDPRLRNQPTGNLNTNWTFDRTLRRSNRPPDVVIPLSQGSIENGPASGASDDPRMYRTPSLPYFDKRSGVSAATIAMQNAMRAATISGPSSHEQSISNKDQSYTNLPASIGDDANFTSDERLPTLRIRRQPSHRDRNDWRIKHQDDARIDRYILRWANNRIHSIRNHPIPGCTCGLDTCRIRRFERGPVCGIRSPPINRQLLPGHLAEAARRHATATGNRDFFCINCGQAMTQWQSVKTHFPFCVLKFGNPNGHSWYDHPSLCVTHNAATGRR